MVESTEKYTPTSLIEKRVIALYVTGILLGGIAGFVIATLIYGWHSLYG